MTKTAIMVDYLTEAEIGALAASGSLVQFQKYFAEDSGRLYEAASANDLIQVVQGENPNIFDFTPAVASTLQESTVLLNVSNYDDSMEIRIGGSAPLQWVAVSPTQVSITIQPGEVPEGLFPIETWVGGVATDATPTPLQVTDIITIPVEWGNQYGGTFDAPAGELELISKTTAGWNAEVRPTHKFTGDGKISFRSTINNSLKRVFFGLDQVHSGLSYVDIDASFYLTAPNSLQMRNGVTALKTLGSHVAGSLFEIERIGNDCIWYVNGVEVHRLDGLFTDGSSLEAASSWYDIPSGTPPHQRLVEITYTARQSLITTA